MTKFVVFGWITVVFFLFVYSFTQIDLGLTLTRLSFWHIIQTRFQQIGYFNRPVSTVLFILIIFMLYVLYFVILNQVRKGNLTGKIVWRLIIFTAVILWFSYNAFSYDLFNYIMDAKMVTFYKKNPYTHKALDFSGDPMLGFMHWTHRYYPYGPLWLLVTIPLSFLGFQKLLATMVLFKGLAATSYLICSFFIYKILEKASPKNKFLGLAIFSFNPLVVIESLVSAHNDVLMMALVLVAFWFLLEKKYLLAWFFLIFSGGVKFVTFSLIPIFILMIWRQQRKIIIRWEKIALLCLILMTVAVLLAIKRDELKPWYILYPLTFLPFLPYDWIFWSITGLSLGSLLHYAPFLYLGNWNPPVPAIKFWLTIGFLLMGFLFGVWQELRKGRSMVK